MLLVKRSGIAFFLDPRTHVLVVFCTGEILLGWIVPSIPERLNFCNRAVKTILLDICANCYWNCTLLRSVGRRVEKRLFMIHYFKRLGSVHFVD